MVQLCIYFVTYSDMVRITLSSDHQPCKQNVSGSVSGSGHIFPACYRIRCYDSEHMSYLCFNIKYHVIDTSTAAIFLSNDHSL